MDEIKSRLWKWLMLFFTAHPLFGLICFVGAIASIIALLFAVCPWITSPKRNLVYCVNPIRTPIVQSVQTSDVSLSYKGRPVSGNVTVAQVAIWNAGREPIRSEDILGPIILRTPDDAAMLEIKPLKITREVIGFALATTNTPSSEAQLGWKILERNDGVLLQITYAGTVTAPIKLEGTIVGQQSIHEGKVGRRRQATGLDVSVLISSGLGLLATGYLFVSQMKEHGPLAKTRVTLGLGGFVCALMMAVLYLVQFFKLTATATPFGF
jgi:hypothetical protein